MSNRLEVAKELARIGFHVFPLVKNRKVPIKDMDFTTKATTDPKQIEEWWKQDDYNIGISTSKFNADKALVVVDIDTKNGKNGYAELEKLKKGGFKVPKTLLQATPSGGKHLIYVNDTALKQGEDVLGHGLDIRSRGGYIVGPRSTIDGKEYRFENSVAEMSAPSEDIVIKCGRGAEKTQAVKIDVNTIDAVEAVTRAIDYLNSHAPLAIQGHAGDHTTFKVACAVKDFGISDANQIASLMFSYWNPRCQPPWNFDDLAAKAKHAVKYGQVNAGAAAPEADFKPIPIDPDKLHPFEKLNKEYAFVTAGGGHHILHETTDAKGRFHLDHLSEPSFHKRFASQAFSTGNAIKPLTKAWMESPNRRSYRGICFRPGRETPEGFYNLWRGFVVEPKSGAESTPEARESVEMFAEHAKKNICGNDESLFQWLIGYFAHLVQKPGEKPLTALVFKGKKGTGKNALVERVGYLLGSHFLVTANRRYLVGNFNGFLENNLMLVLDEAFWSGDKQAEGIMKDLITGQTHNIERKGQEPYSVDNCTRVVIIGNEEWLVPATQDERRFAVFSVGEGRRKDNAFFDKMRIGMENGGYALLLHSLLNFDLSKIDVNTAPDTEGLSEQKHASLTPVHQWWFSCLAEGTIMGSGFGSVWPEKVDTTDFRNAFKRHFDELNIRARAPDDRQFGKALKECAPSVQRGVRREGESFHRIYEVPSIGVARMDWEKFIGHKVKWESL